MRVHIGDHIREELRRQGRTNEWLAEHIGVSRRAVQKIFLKPSIDTQQLFLISEALGVNLFSFYTHILEQNAGTPDKGV